MLCGRRRLQEEPEIIETDLQSQRVIPSLDTEENTKVIWRLGYLYFSLVGWITDLGRPFKCRPIRQLLIH